MCALCRHVILTSTGMSQKALFGPGYDSMNSDEKSSLLPDDTISKPPPKDTFLVAYFIFFLHGIGHLAPWNFFITATAYFDEKFSCAPNSTVPCHDFRTSYENFFSVGANLPLVIMTALNVYLQTRFQYGHRMTVSLVTLWILFVVTTIFVKVKTAQWLPGGFMALTLICVILMNFASAAFQSSTFGLSGLLPSKYTSIVMSGQAVAGVFTSLANIISLAIADSTETAALAYFCCAVIIVLLCLLSLLVLTRLEFVKYYLRNTTAQHSKNAEADMGAKGGHKAAVFVTVIREILGKIWLYALSVFLVFAVTLSVFPGVTSKIVSVDRDTDQSSPWSGKYFTPLTCFLLFNVGDFVGRYITHWAILFTDGRVLLLLSVLRLCFIPLFAICNAVPRTHPALLMSDVYPIFLTSLLGLTNGYLGSIAMIVAPQKLSKKHAETGSTFMALALTGGLFVGGVLSFLLVASLKW